MLKRLVLAIAGLVFAGLVLAGCAAPRAGPDAVPATQTLDPAASLAATLSAATPGSITALPTTAATPGSATVSPTTPETTAPCALTPIKLPTLPNFIPDYAEPDPTTGLHITGQYQVVDLAGYRLQVTGRVARPLSLTYDELRCLPRTQTRAPLVCPGFFTDIATWSGTPIVNVLDRAGILKEATEIRLVSADGYAVTIYMEDARADENFLAYEWEGQPLPILHGFPVRAVFPKMQGSQWLKWLVQIDVQ